jgi:hypothetical protein
VAEDSAGYWPEGAARGVDKKAGLVQAASDRMVPTLGGAGGGAGARAGGGWQVSLGGISVVVQGTGKVDVDVEAAVRRGVDAGIRAIFAGAGVPLDLAITVGP